MFVSEKVVRLLTRREGLAAATSRRRRYGSYLGEIGLGPENLIDHNFRAAAPDESGLPTLPSSTFRAATCIYRMRSTASMGEPVRILVCRGHETITEITSYDRSNRDQEEQEPEGAEAVP